MNELNVLRYQPRVFVTTPRNPEEGRAFVWAGGRWYERIEGETGDVAFPPVAETEEELREWLSQDTPLEEFTEIDRDEDFARLVVDEFQDLPPLYPEAPELSDEPPFSEQAPA